MGVSYRGNSGVGSWYEVPDNEVAAGSTFGGPKVMAIVAAGGGVESVYDIDAGAVVLGSLMVRYYDGESGFHLEQGRPGTFLIHPEHQDHCFTLANGLEVRETVFVLSGAPGPAGQLDPPAVYQWVRLRNPTNEDRSLTSVGFAVLRGNTEHDVRTEFSARDNAFVVWNPGCKGGVRLVGCSRRLTAHEATLDYAVSMAAKAPGQLSGSSDASYDPLGVMRLDYTLPAQSEFDFCFRIVLGQSRRAAVSNYRRAPEPKEALSRTRAYFTEMLARCVVYTPDTHVNQGVLWSKANMLRVQSCAPTGWSFTNDPTRSNNAVARDTSWFGFGADYLSPDFVAASLRGFVDRQERNGMIVEYYDIRTGESEDYGLNINDNTPLLILAVWHHYNVTGDIDFLREMYEPAKKAGRYILSQRNAEGLVWCDATGTADWGIAGWRNVIPNYRLSGATTEINSECFSALKTVSQMARVLEDHEVSISFANEAKTLHEAINRHLHNPDNDLYYLNIDLDGQPRTDITSDLVFPLIFGVADQVSSAALVHALSAAAFWTPAGIRTAPRNSPTYTPTGGWGLLGGVWLGVSFWYAFAVARYSSGFMAQALSTSFRSYSTDPQRNNTVPGQFSEWLNGETLTNQGMMLSPWFPPRYLWAAVEGVGGLRVETGTVTVEPQLAPEWKWLAVRNVPVRGKCMTWLAARMPDVRLFTNFHQGSGTPVTAFEADISEELRVAGGDSICGVALRRGHEIVLFAGNERDRSVSTNLRLRPTLEGRYKLRIFDSLLGHWVQSDHLFSGEDLNRGISVQLERKGFCLLHLMQET
ncbi:MAG TPA: amylo-alpha-1,6-glucosidase [Chloroflexota bacterium]|nr:amylo-alpha-1,6-glucosidase [Chloroflexota bacterium]